MRSIPLPAQEHLTSGYIVYRSAHCVYPCPCGYHGDPVKECTCSLTQVFRYQKRISGPPPRPDRHAKRIDASRVDYDRLTGNRLGESSAAIRARVERARERQRQRFAAGIESRDANAQAEDHVVADPATRSRGSPLQANGDMGPAEVRKYREVDDAGKSLLRSAMP